MTHAPFTDGAVTQVGDLAIEHRDDRVIVDGNTEITRDRAGLEKARLLAASIGAIIRALEADPNLPEQVPARAGIMTAGKNPFE